MKNRLRRKSIELETTRQINFTLTPIIFDEAVSNLDPHTAEQFAQTINKLKGKVTIIFITHQLPSSLQVDEVIKLGKQTILFQETAQQNTTQD